MDKKVIQEVNSSFCKKHPKLCVAEEVEKLIKLKHNNVQERIEGNEGQELTESEMVDFKSKFCKKNRGLCLWLITATGGVIGAVGSGIYQNRFQTDKNARLIDGYLQGKVTADELVANGIDPDKLPPQGVYNQSLQEGKLFNSIVEKHPFLTVGTISALGSFVAMNLRGSRQESHKRAERRDRVVEAYEKGLISDDELRNMNYDPEHIKELVKSKQLSEAIEEAYSTFYSELI